VKGLFSVMLGKYFSKIEKPYYTVIEDYVCFSNTPETIISLIEDYENKNTLGNDDEFKTFINRCDEKASLFCYINGPRYYSSMISDLKEDKRKTAIENKKYITCFQHTAFQLISNNHIFETRLLSHFSLPDDADDNKTPAEPQSMQDKDTLTTLEQFYVEQFTEGSILDNYPNGNPKVRVETKDGLKSGKYREYYEDGSIKVKGSYSKGKKDGRWRYYSKEGKVTKREKYDAGTLVE
jgi:hypothetical protein